jgi:hypothetical protein
VWGTRGGKDGFHDCGFDVDGALVVGGAGWLPSLAEFPS